MTDKTQAENASKDRSRVPGCADLPRRQESDEPEVNPNVETDHLDDLMPDKNGYAEGRPIPTGV